MSPIKKPKFKIPFSRTGLGKDRDYFIENMSLLVGSGLSLPGTIDSIITEVRSRRMKKILLSIRQAVDDGSPMWRALQDSGLIKDHALTLIRLGEESGNLVENLKVVEIQEEKDRTFRAKLSSAMMYPVLVLALTAIIGIGIAWFILPKLALVFSQLRIKLPIVTKVLISIGSFLGVYGIYVVPAVVSLLIATVYFVFFCTRTKALGQWLYFYIPGINRLVKDVEIARFGYLLSTLLQAGIAPTQALNSLANATEFSRYRKLYSNLSQSIDAGNSFQKSFAKLKHINRLIPAPIQQLIVSGEKSGNLPEILLKIGVAFENKADTATKNLTTILEPILLVIVWLGVVAVALAVILPIYSLVGNLNP
jgi:type II secretory pathway component PulF